ncbi:MAG: MogA/MoaB family molybdenum cofactor biosynthesis protein [Nitrospira sp.]|nr:MogA/MoaB family molybdenum cofactor biosynthesis protein [Nitrospira sp.]
MTNSPAHEHKQDAPRSLRCMVITCSDTRTPETDTSGQLIHSLLAGNGHTVVAYHIIKDDPGQITHRIALGTFTHAAHIVIVNGGTGISRRDSTFEAVDSMLEKRLDGFGELFRYLTYQEIGSSVVNGCVVFSIPGSEHAVRLAMEKLILPELGHLVKELTK